MKKIALLVVEFIIIFYLGIILIVGLTGGFSIPFGLLIFSVHSLKSPGIILLGALLLRRLLVGSFLKDFTWLHLIRRLGPNRQTLSDRLLLILVILFLIMEVIALTNPLQRGLTGYYYDNEEWAAPPIMTARDFALNFNRINRIVPAITEHFSIEWTGAIFIPATGLYEFSTVSKDGSELSIDNQLVVDNRGIHAEAQRRTGSISLEKGFYSIKIRHHFLEGEEGAVFKAYWKRPGHKRRGLSQPFLFIETPTKEAFFTGQCLEIALIVCKICLFIWGGSVALLGLSKYDRLSPALKHLSVLALIFLMVFISHFTWSSVYTPFDSGWNVHTAISIIEEGNTDLDEYRGLMTKGDHRIQRIDGHIYNFFPVGTSVLSLPHILILDKLSDEILEIDMIHIIKGKPERFIAATIVALSAVLIYLIVSLFLDDQKYLLLLVFIFAFCTSAWSTASRALWQHGPTMLLLSAALYLLLLAKHKPKYESWLIRFVGIPLALSYVVRPTNSISILLFTIFIFIRHRKYFWSYCLWSMFIAIPFLTFNLSVYHSILSPYYLPNRLGSNPDFFEALAGNLISPSRGIFIFTPVLLFSLYGIFLKIRNKQMTLLDFLLLAIMILHWIIISTFNPWCGGHSYGPRFFSDMLPYFIYFLIPVFTNIPKLQGVRKISVVLLLCCSIAISFFIHYRGATNWDVYLWNVGPISVEGKLWDWHDLQFLEGL